MPEPNTPGAEPERFTSARNMAFPLHPRISVVIPCHNREGTIARALESVFSQDSAADEVIVVDDASTDNSRSVASEYPIKLLVNPTNVGAGASRNRGIAAASGALIACLDSDDWWLDEHLRTMRALHARFPTAVAMASGVRRQGPRMPAAKVSPGRIPTLQLVDAFEQSFAACPMPHQSTVLRKDAARAIGGYTEDLRHADDFDLYLRLSRVGPFVLSPEITAVYWAHGGQLTSSGDKVVGDIYRSRLRMIETVAGEGDVRLAGLLRKRLDVIFRQDLLAEWQSRQWAVARTLLDLGSQWGLGTPMHRLFWRSAVALHPLVISGSGETRAPKRVQAALRRLLGHGRASDRTVN
jgi:glycosyltransferase involved in cell wall biosynthesis